jgi:signal transduction histidine kinase
VRPLLQKPVQALSLLFLGLFFAVTILVAILGLRTMDRIERIRLHVGETDRLQRVGLRLPGLLAGDRVEGDSPTGDPPGIAELDQELGEILKTHTHLDASTPRKLAAIRTSLNELERTGTVDSDRIIEQFQEILEAETVAEGKLLKYIEKSSRFELVLSTALVVAALLVAAAGLVVFRRRIRTATGILMEQQRHLAQAERLAMIGEMAAHLAHDLRNPLAGIQVSLSNLHREIDDPDQQRRLSQAASEVERINRRVRSLLHQVRPTSEPTRRLRLAPLVEDLLGLARYQVPATTRLSHRIPADLDWQLPEDRLRQAILNLVLNATEALGESPGTVTVDARKSAEGLEIAVTDDGPGFPEELLDGGIRPFQSTRNGGTGLGLSIVRRFVSDLGGELRLARPESGGARVSLWFPNPARDTRRLRGDGS